MRTSSIAVSVLRKVQRAAAAVVLSVFVSSPCIAQTVEADSTETRERALLAEIKRLVADEGPLSEGLIGPVTALSLLYEEAGVYPEADQAVERVTQLIQANHGVYALEQAPGIRLLIRREEQRGNAQAAWDLEQALLALAEHHRDDPRSALILHDAADKRMEILSRYEAGEFPPEIKLGCYYRAAATYEAGWAQTSRPIDASSGPMSDSTGAPFDVPFNKPENSCASGSQSRARNAIALEAEVFYVAALNILRNNPGSSASQLSDLLQTLVRVSHRNENYNLGRMSLIYLIAHQTNESTDTLERIRTMLSLGDWHLAWVQHMGKRLEAAAMKAYLDAYALAVDQGIPQSSIEDIFRRDEPVVLPAFLPNPLLSPQTSTSTGFVDVTFVVTEDGKSKDINILDTTTEGTRTTRKDLVRLIKRSRFRPVISADGIVDEAPMTIRYYVDE